MDYTQNPFLKDDNVYYSEVEDIKDDVNALASEISQINITLTDDIKNVDERLNAYQNSIKQNVFTNKLDANVANINTAYINDINAKNVRTNVLDVNVLNVASINNTVLANPHIENMDAVNGQILKAEIKDSVIVNGSGSFDSLNTNTINIESGSIKRTNIADSTLTNVVINGFDLNNPRYLNANNADFNVANFNSIYGVNADFDYIQRVNTDDVRTTNIIVNGAATLHYLNANNANIGNIINTNISNATLYDIKVVGDLGLSDNLIANDINANTVKVKDLNATNIAVQSLTDVNLIHANNVSSDWGYIQNLGVHNLTLDVSKEPKETPYVLGYDTNGNIFPAIAQGGGGGSVILPADADYIYTDTQGLPLKGTVATDLSDTNALVKAGLVATLSNQTNEQVNTLTNQVNTLSDQVNEITDMLSILNELKPNATADYFNSASPLDYKSITAFAKGKANRSDRGNYTVVADGLLGFTGIKVDNNTLHFDSTLNNFYLNKDLSYMFNGCSNFDGTGFDAIPEGTTNTAYMFAYTKIKKPYKLPASVIDSNNMYENVVFEITAGEAIDGISDVTYNINSGTVLDLNVINSQDVRFLASRENRNVNDTKLNITNSSFGFATSFTDSGAPDVVFNGGNIYLDNVYFYPFGQVINANVTLKGNIKSGSTVDDIKLSGCEINAINIDGWTNFSKIISNGNVHIGENTPVKGMFGGDVWWGGTNVFPKIVYPENRTSWAGLYYNANDYNKDFLNEILPNATNVDEMFYSSYNNNLFYNQDNILNILNVLNKNITSLYKFCDTPNALHANPYAYNSLTELKATFHNAKNVGYSNLIWPGSTVTESEVAGFTDISGLYVTLPTGTTTFNVPTLTTLDNVFDSDVNNVNIVISNNCTLAPNVSNDYQNRFLTGDLSGIKNGYYLYHYATQWHGYPESLESAPYMYAQAQFAGEIGDPLPAGLTNTSRMFNACLNITSMPGIMDLSNCKDASDMFHYCPNLTSVDFNFLKTLKPGSTISYMFSNCPNLVCNDINVFTWIPEGVNAFDWFGGMLVSDVNTNNESIISMLNGLNVAGNVDISINVPKYILNVLSINPTGPEDLKSLNVNIDTSSLSDINPEYMLNAFKYNISVNGKPTQDVLIRNLGNPFSSYFEVSNCKNIQFDGGERSAVENSRFVFRNIDNACINGKYSYGGPQVLMYNSVIELNNINYFNLNIMSANNVHLSQMPINGFRLSSIIVDSAASIDVIDRSSYLSNVSFIDNRLNINTLANTLSISTVYNVTDIYLNSVAANGMFSGRTNNVIIHIPTNADLATGLNNGTYGSFPNENIIQY